MSTYHIGLQIDSILQPMKIDGEVDVKRIAQIIPDVYQSVGGYYGEDLTTLYSMELRASGDPMDRDGDLYSGYVELPFNGIYDRSGDIYIKQNIPLPMHILGIGVRLQKETV